MKASARYAKIVEWSAEDNCYVGSAPGLILGGHVAFIQREVEVGAFEIGIAFVERDGFGRGIVLERGNLEIGGLEDIPLLFAGSLAGLRAQIAWFFES